MKDICCKKITLNGLKNGCFPAKLGSISHPTSSQKHVVAQHLKVNHFGSSDLDTNLRSELSK